MEGQSQEQEQEINDQSIPIPEINNISFTPIIITRSQPRNNFNF